MPAPILVTGAIEPLALDPSRAADRFGAIGSARVRKMRFKLKKLLSDVNGKSTVRRTIPRQKPLMRIPGFTITQAERDGITISCGCPIRCELAGFYRHRLSSVGSGDRRQASGLSVLVHVGNQFQALGERIFLHVGNAPERARPQSGGVNCTGGEHRKKIGSGSKCPRDTFEPGHHGISAALRVKEGTVPSPHLVITPPLARLGCRSRRVNPRLHTPRSSASAPPSAREQPRHPSPNHELVVTPAAAGCPGQIAATIVASITSASMRM